MLKKCLKSKLKVTQSCLTLCDPMDYTVHGIPQARILEWVAFPFSRGSSNLGIKPRSHALQVDSLPAAIWETWVRPLSWKYPLEKGKTTLSNILAWGIPWTV